MGKNKKWVPILLDRSLDRGMILRNSLQYFFSVFLCLLIFIERTSSFLHSQHQHQFKPKIIRYAVKYEKEKEVVKKTIGSNENEIIRSSRNTNDIGKDTRKKEETTSDKNEEKIKQNNIPLSQDQLASVITPSVQGSIQIKKRNNEEFDELSPIGEVERWDKSDRSGFDWELEKARRRLTAPGYSPFRMDIWAPSQLGTIDSDITPPDQKGVGLEQIQSTNAIDGISQ